MNNYPGMHSIYGHGMGGWMFLWWLLIIVLIVTSMVFFFRQTNSKNEKSALDILKERYARGEVSKEEFEQIKSDLK